jgi:hypothetical protein
MRTSELEFDGQKYKFGKLTSGQVDELVFANFDIKQEDGKIVATAVGGKRALRNQMCPVIAAAFNNAIAGDGKWFFDGWEKPASVEGEAWYTARDVFGTLDYDDTVRAYNEISELSGLRSQVKKASPSGEGKAVDTTANNSNVLSPA